MIYQNKKHSDIPTNTNPIKTGKSFTKLVHNDKPKNVFFGIITTYLINPRHWLLLTKDLPSRQGNSVLGSLNEEKATLFFANQLPLENNENITALNTSREGAFPASPVSCSVKYSSKNLSIYVVYWRGIISSSKFSILSPFTAPD